MRRAATRHLLFLKVSVAASNLVVLFGGTAAAGQAGFVYTLREVTGGANQIYGFRFDPGLGALIPLPGFPVASGGTGTGSLASEQLAYLDGRLYAINDGDNTLTAFSVNRSTGALTAMPFSPVALGTGNWACVAVHASGSPVVVGNQSGGVASFVVTSSTATAAAGSPFATDTAFPSSCAFSQDGNYFYTGGGGFGGSIAGFSVTAGTGVLTALAGSPYDSGAGNPIAYATDGSGRLFVSSPLTGMLIGPRVLVYTLASGVLAGVSGNPFISGVSRGAHGVLHPGGFYLVADRLGHKVASFQIVGTGADTTLNAVSGSPFESGGPGTIALTVTQDGGHVVAANTGSRNLTVFEIDARTGTLTPVIVQSVNSLGASGNVSGLAFAQRAEGGFVYALEGTDGGPNQIYGFRLNPTGTLTPLPDFPIASGGTASAFSFFEHVAYLNGRLYIVNDGTNTVTAFKVNRTTGALTALPFSPITLPSGVWSCVAVHPSGSPLVVGDNGSFVIASFDVAATTAAPAAGSPFATGTARPWSCEFSRDGKYLYTGTGTGGSIAAFGVDSASGVLAALPGSPFASGNSQETGYATDSSGRLFMVDAFTPPMRIFTTSAGVPTPVTGNPFESGLLSGYGAVWHPSGFYVVADGHTHVGVYRIAGSDAASTLTAVPGSPFDSIGSTPRPVALSDDATYLIVANMFSRNLTVFRVNPATGRLLLSAGQNANTLGTTGLITGVALAPVAQPFIDDPLSAGTDAIKAVHITELRVRIDAVRAQYGLGPYSYADPTLGVATTMIRAEHVEGLRTSLAEAYAAAGLPPPPSYTDPTLTTGATFVKAAHIIELRSAVAAIE